MYLLELDDVTHQPRGRNYIIKPNKSMYFIFILYIDKS